MKKFLLVLAAVSSAGCVPQIVQLPVVPNVSGAVKIVDNRPAWEKVKAIGSLAITSCAYGIFRRGEEQTIPDRITYLAQKLYADAASTRTAKVITVDTFTVYMNAQASIRGAAAGTIAGPLLGAALPEIGRSVLSTNGCDPEFVPGGVYPQEMTSDGKAMAVANLTVTIDGIEHHARAVGSQEKEGTEGIVVEVVDKLIADINK